MQLHFEVEGAGQPLIILHGLLGSCQNWRTQKKLFSKSYQVFALDLRNHGRSPHSESFNLQVMAEDLRQFMEQHALSTAHLLGHSLGGKVAMQFAANQPERVGKLIFVDIAPKAYKGEHGAILEAMESLDLKVLRSRVEADAALAPKISEPSMRHFLLKNIARDEKGRLQWGIGLNAISKNYHETIKGVALTRPLVKPTLFIKGENSQYIEEKDIPAVKRVFPRAEVVTIAGAGHWVHIDAPDKFHSVVLTFLSRN
ncbi:MAG: alpha/beta fold hydrolase [Candidatus Binatia bacterium]